MLKVVCMNTEVAGQVAMTCLYPLCLHGHRYRNILVASCNTHLLFVTVSWCRPKSVISDVGVTRSHSHHTYLHASTSHIHAANWTDDDLHQQQGEKLLIYHIELGIRESFTLLQLVCSSELECQVAVSQRNSSTCLSAALSLSASFLAVVRGTLSFVCNIFFVKRIL